MSPQHATSGSPSHSNPADPRTGSRSPARPRTRRSGLSAVFMALGLAGAWCVSTVPTVATAGALTDQLSTAQKALVAKDTAAATTAIDAAELAATQLEAIARPGIIGRVHYYRGMVAKLAGDQDAAMDEWRTALLIDNSLQWDEAILADGPAQDLFEALRKEVRDRPEVDSVTPPLVGLAKLYVDGGRICPGDKVQEGTHLIQVDCPEDRIYGDWVTFPKKKVKWLKLCPNGVDVTAVPVAEEPQEEDMFGFGDALGEEEEGCPLPGEAPAVADVEPEPAGPVDVPPGPAPLIEHRVSWPMVAAGTGLLVGGGVALAIAQSRHSTFEATAGSMGSPGEIETAAKKVNNVAWVGTGLSVVGGGLCVAAVIPW